MEFTKKFKTTITISLCIMLVGLIVGIFFGGLNLGVDFTGGTLVTIDFKNVDFDMDVVTSALEANGVVGAQAVRSGNTTSSQTMSDIRMPNLGNDAAESELRAAVIDTIRNTYPEAEITSVDRVDGVASGSLIRNAFLSIAIASVCMLVYISVRFEFLFGCAAVIALLHDVAIMLSIVAIFRVPVNSPFIAAVLTIVGYSINNTIVVFDRVRETSKHESHLDRNRGAIVNASINGTLMRSINTTITTLLTITMVYFLGVESIREFALPIIVGLLAGAYSSIFLAGPMWAKLHLMQNEKKSTTSHKKSAKNGGKKAKAK